MNGKRGLIAAVFLPYLELLRYNRPYVLLWLAEAISLIGDWLSHIATLSMVMRFSNSSLAISGLLILKLVPNVLFSSFAGVAADSFDKRHIMIASDILRMVVVLGFLVVRSDALLPLLYVLVFALFAVSAFFQPARSGILPALANSLDSIAWSSMLFIGSAVGGLITATLGKDVCFVLDACTFALSAVLVGLLLGKPVAPPPRPAVHDTDFTSLADGQVQRDDVGPPTNAEVEAEESDVDNYVTPAEVDPDVVGRDELECDVASNRCQKNPLVLSVCRLAAPARAASWMYWQGLVYLFSNQFMLAMTLQKISGASVWASIEMANIRLAEDEFPIYQSSQVTLGLMYSVVGLGTGAGPLVANTAVQYFGVGERSGTSWSLFGAYIILAMGNLGVAWSPNVWAYLLFNFVRSLATGALWVGSSAMLQLLVEEKFRGRVFAFDYGAVMFSETVAYIVGGLLLDEAGWTARQVALGCFAMSSVICVGWSVYFCVLAPSGARLLPIREECGGAEERVEEGTCDDELEVFLGFSDESGNGVDLVPLGVDDDESGQ